jgi:hypothetical protein
VNIVSKIKGKFHHAARDRPGSEKVGRARDFCLTFVLLFKAESFIF